LVADEITEQAAEGKTGDRTNWIEVRIEDDGPGIPPEIRSKLLEPFVTTKPSGEGSGLGLWIVRSTLMALGGSVQVESESGRGAAFIVRLPLAAAPASVAS
jgi:signal transduction histidine kinase